MGWGSRRNQRGSKEHLEVYNYISCIYQFEIYEYVYIYIFVEIYLPKGWKVRLFLCHVGVNGAQNQYLVVSLGPPSKDTTTYTVYVYLKPN